MAVRYDDERLFVADPQAAGKRLTLILLANSDGLSSPFDLPSGDVTKSLFAVLFLRLFALRLAVSRALTGLALLSHRVAGERRTRRVPTGRSLRSSGTLSRARPRWSTSRTALRRCIGTSGPPSPDRRGPFGVEGLFLCVPHFFESDEASAVTSSNTYSLMGNVVLTTPLKWNEYGLRPYVSGGLGLMHVAQQPRIANMFPINENFLGYNVGGGATGFITDRTGLRFDLRYYSSLTRSEGSPSFGAVRLRYWTGAVGVVLRY